MRTARLATGLALAAVVAWAPGARGADATHGGAAGPHVHTGFAAFSPADVDVVTGETVTWTNDSVRAHDVVADDGRFASGRMAPGARFARRFEVPEVVPFHCNLHAGMRGRVVVSPLLLDAPAGAAGPGRPFGLRGRAGLPPGTPVIVVGEPEGGVARPVATSVVDHDGRFAAEVTPGATTTYRATAGAAASPPVTLLVLDRRVRGSVRRTARSARVRVAVAPAAPGGTVVLQARAPERFGWYPLQRARLDDASRAGFRIALRRRLPLRVVLTLPDGATVLGSSGPLGPPRGR